MTNQQHIDWLLEGAASWNARRKRDDFRPDFQEANIQGAFEAAGKLDERGRFDLRGADLREADLRGTDLRRANLRGADLGKADLRGANLVGANLGKAELTGADLRGANLRGADLREAELTGAYLGGAELTGAYLGGADLGKADLRGANLVGANVRTFVYSAADTNDGAAAEYTDLSATIGLTQKQVDGMDGDSGTILPDHVTRPAHWPELGYETDSEEGNSSGEADSGAASASPALRQHVAFLLRVAPSAADTALHTASQIELAVSEARMNTQDEPALFLQVATALKTLSIALTQADDKDIEIAKLEAIVATQKAEIERLTALIANMPSAKAQIMVAALGGAGATAITGTLGYMFGTDGADMINNLLQFFNSGGGLPPPPQPLPPTVTT